MFIETDKLKNKKFDLCIVGSGPAGIITALEFRERNPGSSILLVDAGFRTRERNKLDDSIVNHNLTNHHAPYDFSQKVFGGTSAQWGGRCVMYDPIDFKPHGPLSKECCTWDLRLLEQIEHFRSKAAGYLDAGDPRFTLKDCQLDRGPVAENFPTDELIDDHIERYSLPTRFGKKYYKELDRCEVINVLLGYSAKSFGLSNVVSGQIDSIELESSASGEIVIAYSDQFVLAAGGVESTRLLLQSSNVFKRLESIPDALGKYYQSHITGKIAYINFYGSPEKTDFDLFKDRDGVFLRRRIKLLDSKIESVGLLNTVFWLDNPPYHDPKHRNGILSLIYLMMISPVLGRRLLPKAVGEMHFKKRSGASSVIAHFFNILRDFPKSFFVPAGIFFKRYFPKRKLPGVFLKSKSNIYGLQYHAEQLPHVENQLWLDDGKLHIRYRFMKEDIDSILKSHELIDEALRASGCGELIYMYPKEELRHIVSEEPIAGVHQIGTTRIGKSPEEGVVDWNLRVHGTENLFVCSSSVFPTSSQANPTFMIAACAVRLANHLSDLRMRDAA